MMLVNNANQTKIANMVPVLLSRSLPPAPLPIWLTLFCVDIPNHVIMIKPPSVDHRTIIRSSSAKSSRLLDCNNNNNNHEVEDEEDANSRTHSCLVWIELIKCKRI